MSRFCVIAGTKISLNDGTTLPIEKINAGQEIISFNLNTLQKSQNNEILLTLSTDTFDGIIQKDLVKNIWKNTVEEYYSINDKLKITGEHIVLAKRDKTFYWTTVDKLLIGDYLFTEQNIFEKIDMIILIKEKVKVYNLQVNDVYNYFANSYLIHNGMPCTSCTACGSPNLGRISGLKTINYAAPGDPIPVNTQLPNTNYTGILRIGATSVSSSFGVNSSTVTQPWSSTNFTKYFPNGTYTLEMDSVAVGRVGGAGSVRVNTNNNITITGTALNPGTFNISGTTWGLNDLIQEEAAVANMGTTDISLNGEFPYGADTPLSTTASQAYIYSQGGQFAYEVGDRVKIVNYNSVPQNLGGFNSGEVHVGFTVFGSESGPYMDWRSSGISFDTPHIKYRTQYFEVTSVISELYIFTSHTFTNCGAYGQNGPATIADCRTSYGGSINDGNWWNDNTTNWLDMNTNEPGIQLWTVPFTGSYSIVAYGADATVSKGGKGAIIGGDFNLVKGDIIYILVGQTPWGTSNNAATISYMNHCGAGGTFVIKEPSAYFTTKVTSSSSEAAAAAASILVIAGGGGGSHAYNVTPTAQHDVHAHGQPVLRSAHLPNTDFVLDNSGGGGTLPGPTFTTPATYGDGGLSPAGQGGGGFTGDGVLNATYTGGAKSYASGGTGGIAGNFHGGFGGGGRHGNTHGGGGGGYSGGGGSIENPYEGGGGGSYNSGSNQTVLFGKYVGHLGSGKVIITKIN